MASSIQNVFDGISKNLYSPLDESKDEIRLITLLPRSDGRESPVRCELETVSLKNYTPEYCKYLFGGVQDSAGAGKDVIPLYDRARWIWGDYVALSYVWGDPRKTSIIIINGYEAEVTVNLEAALREISGDSEFVDANRCKLWVDAISINQHDPDERGRQIVRMQRIYSTAKSVLAWLGKEADESDTAIELIGKLSELAKDGKGKDVEASLRNSPEYLGKGCWLALQDLMQREYWRRLWIIQEIVLGGSKVQIRCGHQSLCWSLFCAGLHFLYQYLWNVKDMLLRHDMARCGSSKYSTGWATVNLNSVQLLRRLSRSEQRRSDYESFGLLLELAGPASASDIRDKAYGLVGIMDPAIGRQLSPDYKMPPSRAFIAVAKAFITVAGNLEPLRAGNCWSKTETPSWAADWSWAGNWPWRFSRVGSRSRALDGWLLAAPQEQKVGIPSLLPYQASGNSVMRISFSSDDTKITCQGFLVDEISGLGAASKDRFKWLENTIIQPPKNQINAYGDIHGISNALYRTLIADRDGFGKKASERHTAILSLPADFKNNVYPQCFKLGWKWLCEKDGYYYRWEGWRKANKNFLLGNRPLDDYFSETIPSNASESDYNEVWSCYDQTSKGRRFAVTKKGYLGWVPDNIYGSEKNLSEYAMIGDLVAVIFGCSTPILLRLHGEDFKVVGETYIHGLMDGESMEFLKMGVGQVRDFTLC